MTTRHVRAEYELIPYRIILGPNPFNQFSTSLRIVYWYRRLAGTGKTSVTFFAFLGLWSVMNHAHDLRKKKRREKKKEMCIVGHVFAVLEWAVSSAHQTHSFTTSKRKRGRFFFLLFFYINWITSLSFKFNFQLLNAWGLVGFILL